MLANLPWRLIGYGLAVVALLAFGWRVHEWRQGYLARDAAEARSREIAKEASEAMALLAEQHRAALAASKGYQDELQSLRANRKPAPVVRLCHKPAVPATGAQGGTAPGPDGAAPGAGELQEANGGDNVGPELYGLADDADELAARLRALQEWVRKTR